MLTGMACKMIWEIGTAIPGGSDRHAQAGLQE